MLLTHLNLVPWGLYKRSPARRPELTSWPLLRNDMDRLMDSFFGDSSRGSDDETMLSPSLDVAETDKEFSVRVELPGVKEENIDVSVADQMLTIRGEKKEESEQNEKNFHRSERRFGSFQRAVELPQNVDAEKVTADFNNGVLSIHIPKTATAAARKVKIGNNHQKGQSA